MKAIKVYIASKITGEENYKAKFAEKEKEMSAIGCVVMNPAILPYPGFEHHQYMHICKAMIDVCDAVLLFDNWKDSDGALMELEYALKNEKCIWSDQWSIPMIKRLMQGGANESDSITGLIR